MRRSFVILSVLVVALLQAVPAPALAPGDRDPSFSNDGLATTSLDASGGDTAFGVAVWRKKTVVLATAGFNTGALLRFRRGGGLDSTFSGDGKMTFPLGTSQEEMGLAIQSDGKIVVAFRRIGSGPNDRNFAVRRFKPGGAIDTSFGGGDGLVTMDFAGANDDPSAVAIQSDGKIVVVGEASFPSEIRAAVARFTASGTPDSTFGGGDGKVATLVSGASSASSLRIQPDGKIAVAGLAGAEGSNNNFLVLRYRTNGNLDPTFSGDGKAQVSFHMFDSAEAVTLQTDGAIVVAGTTYPDVSGSPEFNDANWALARLHPNGTLDHTFSTDGKAVTVFGDHNDFLSGVVVQSSGKIIAVGDSLQGSDFVGALARYKAGGALDHGFGGNGKVLDDFGSAGFLQDVRNYPGDRIVAGVSVRVSGSDFDPGAARYLAG